MVVNDIGWCFSASKVIRVKKSYNFYGTQCGVVRVGINKPLVPLCVERLMMLYHDINKMQIL